MTRVTQRLSIIVPAEEFCATDELVFEIIRAVPKQGSFVATVLFLPFWGGTARTFSRVIDDIVTIAADVQCLAISYPGTGCTPRTLNDRPTFNSIEARAAQLEALLEHSKFSDMLANRPVMICAHSMSAKITYALLAKISKRATPLINLKALALLSPAPVGPLELPAEARTQQLLAYRTFERAAWTIQNILTAGTLTSEDISRAAEDAVSMGESTKQGWLQHGMIYDCSDDVHVVHKAFPELRISVLVGDKDQVETVNRVEEETVGVLVIYGFRVKFRVLPSFGHLLPLEASTSVSAAIVELL